MCWRTSHNFQGPSRLIDSHLVDENGNKDGDGGANHLEKTTINYGELLFRGYFMASSWLVYGCL